VAQRLRGNLLVGSFTGSVKHSRTQSVRPLFMRLLLKSRKEASTTLRGFAFEVWPYVFILISITGLAYEALVAWH